MFRKILLATVALTFVAAPFAAEAQTQHPQYRHGVQQRHDMHRPAPQAHWRKGQRYNDWRKHQEIRDYQRYGLRKPGRGQRWIRVGNEYLLVTAATGFIAGILAAH